ADLGAYMSPPRCALRLCSLHSFLCTPSSGLAAGPSQMHAKPPSPDDASLASLLRIEEPLGLAAGEARRHHPKRPHRPMPPSSELGETEGRGRTRSRVHEPAARFSVPPQGDPPAVIAARRALAAVRPRYPMHSFDSRSVPLV